MDGEGCALAAGQQQLFGVMSANTPPPRLRFQGGDLYVSWSGGTNWARHARVYNPWRIWIARLRADAPLRITCINNLKQIGLSFRQWAIDHGDQYSFNVSTNTGGSMEFRAVGKDGFDRNASFHFQVMSNELNTPRLLVCPNDPSKKAATDFKGLEAMNVTYQMRSGTNLSESNPREVLLLCPIDGNILFCDGTVKEGKQ